MCLSRSVIKSCKFPKGHNKWESKWIWCGVNRPLLCYGGTTFVIWWEFQIDHWLVEIDLQSSGYLLAMVVWWNEGHFWTSWLFIINATKSRCHVSRCFTLCWQIMQVIHTGNLCFTCCSNFVKITGPTQKLLEQY